MTRPMTNEAAAVAAAAAGVDGGVVIVVVAVSKFASLLMQHVYNCNANIMQTTPHKHQQIL